MANARTNSGYGFFVETTFVLFFLSLDFGQNLFYAGFDTLFLAMTIIALAIFPYFLPSAAHIRMSSWITGRSVIVVSGILLGVGLFHAAGTVLPPAVRFLPLSMALITGAIACYLMFSSFFRVSFAE